MSLPEFSVRQVVLVNLFFVIAMLGGSFAFRIMPIENYPDISFNSAMVTTIWMGASADEIERLVTTKIEEEVRDISGIKELRSTSASDVSVIDIEWKEELSDTEHEAALNELRAAADRVTDLPNDAEQPLIRELSMNEVNPTIIVSVLDTEDLGDLPLLEVARDAKARLEDVPGVDKIIIRGEQEREVRVLVNRDAAARFGLTVVEIADRLRRSNMNLPAGSFTGRAGESTLRATGDFESLAEIEDAVLLEAADGSVVRLRDVAVLEEGLEKRRFISRMNGHSSLALFVMKSDNTDAIVLSGRVNRWVEEQQARLPRGFELVASNDQSRWVQTRMSVLFDNLWTGLIVVALILWLTLGLRNMILTVIAIPFSFLAAFTLFPLFDLTINSISVVGLLLVSGMLVDDAIIVLENIYRRIESGEERRSAIVEGTRQVMWPVIAAVATTAAAFLPLLLIPGTSGKFMSILPKAVIICLGASLLECLVVLPAHYLDFGSRRAVADEVGRTSHGIFGRLSGAAYAARALVDRGIRRLGVHYLKALDAVLENRRPFGALIFAIVVFAVAATTRIGIDMFPTDFDTFQIALETPTEFSLEQTDAVMADVEAKIVPLEGEVVEDTMTYVGNTIYGGFSQRTAPNVAISYLSVVQTPEYRINPLAALARVDERLETMRETDPRVVEIRAIKPRNGPPIGKPIAVRIRSDDYQRNKRISLEMQRYLATIPGVTAIEDNLEDGPSEFRLVLDAQRAAQHGLEFEDLARALRGANDGLVTTSFRAPTADDDVDLRVLLAPEYRTNISDLLQSEVRTPAGYLVKIGDVADIAVSQGFLELVHYDSDRTVTVYADVDGKLATSVSANRQVAAHFAHLAETEPEVKVNFGGEFQATAETFSAMWAILPLAMLLIYMILAAVFRSYVQPVVVITAIPMGIVGTIFGIAVLGYSVSMYMVYAVIGMMGVAVNDALVMVTFVNDARENGVPTLEAIRTSGAARLRPILLTTLTTTGALMPMALGLQGGSTTFGPFAAAIVFGLMFAMVGTLFVVPLAYTVLVDFTDSARGKWNRWRGSPSTSSDLAAHSGATKPDKRAIGEVAAAALGPGEGHG